jgi:hypothetical protein
MSMSPNHIISLLQQNYTTVGVRFIERVVRGSSPSAFSVSEYNENSKVYAYKAPLNLNLQAGDFVVVPNGLSNKDIFPFVMARVTGVDERARIDFNTSKHYKWIVQKIDTAQYDAIIGAERAMHDVLQAAEERRQRESFVVNVLDKLNDEERSRLDAALAPLGAALKSLEVQPAGEAKPE